MQGGYIWVINLVLKKRDNLCLRNIFKDHLFEYIADFIGQMLFTILIMYICKAEDFLRGIIVSTAYYFTKLIYNLYHYKKEYINVNIK